MSFLLLSSQMAKINDTIIGVWASFILLLACSIIYDRLRRKPKVGEVWRYKKSYYLITGIDGERIYYRNIVIDHITDNFDAFDCSPTYYAKDVYSNERWSFFKINCFKYANSFEEFVKKHRD